MKPIVISGFMATGKSTVGRLVADRLGLPFADTDELLAEATGKPVPELFLAEGEARFREREADLVLPMLADPTPRVIAFGGGTATIRRVRYAALEATTLVTLGCAPETLIARIASMAGRPNLATRDPASRAADLLSLRREAYAECHAAIETDGLAPEAVADRVVAAAMRDTLAMPLGMRSYAVELCEGAPERLTTLLDELRPSSIVVITDENVAAARGAWLDAALGGRDALRLTIVPGEASKHLETVSRLWDAVLTRGIDRDAVVLGFGGGVVGDIAGFVASTLLRGVRCVQIATSLLAMVDSSAGGKTGFDHPAGKNLIGSFFQPRHVLIDLEHLTTLPVRERAAGLAEVVKIALVRDASLLERLEREAHRLRAGELTAFRDVVRQAVLAKIRVVRDDERETGDRALLNLGHTVGHALESHGRYTSLLHGEAVAIGTVLEMAACERMGLTPTGLAERAASVLDALGLPTTASRDVVEAAWPFVLSDKKRAASRVKLPVVTGPGEGRVEKVALDALRAALLA